MWAWLSRAAADDERDAAGGPGELRKGSFVFFAAHVSAQRPNNRNPI